jgi:hypothetical protein
MTVFPWVRQRGSTTAIYRIAYHGAVRQYLTNSPIVPRFTADSMRCGGDIDAGTLRTPRLRGSVDFPCKSSTAIQQTTQMLRVDGDNGRPSRKYVEQLLDQSGALADRAAIESGSATADSVCKLLELYEPPRIAGLYSSKQFDEVRELVACTLQKALPNRRQLLLQSGLLARALHPRMSRVSR